MPEWSNPQPRLEFRIPISPTDGFFSQVRLFNFALRRLGGPYGEACLRVIVGDKCDLDAVRRANEWSLQSNIVWERVPNALFDEAGIWGTANWRLNLPPGDADLIFLADADTVLLRDIDPILRDFSLSLQPAVRGHMAHIPPPRGSESAEQPMAEFWPDLLTAYGTEYRGPLVRYSMDMDKVQPLAPPYFNLGFIAMNPAALVIFGQDIHWTESWLKHRTGSPMRCQIALSLIACRHGMDISCLPAQYNAANDEQHLAANHLSIDDIRVLHYLRENEFRRNTFLILPERDDFIQKPLNNPANRILQQLVREYSLSL